MSSPWTSTDAPSGLEYSDNSVTVIDGSTFCISEPNGDVVCGTAQGLFVRDTRIISRWQLVLDGATASGLAVHHKEPYAAAFIGRMLPPPGLADSTLLVVRRRSVGNGMVEHITIQNSAREPVACTLSVLAAADMADLFEVKGARAAPSHDVHRDVAKGQLRITRPSADRSDGVLISAPNALADADGLHWDITIPARESWSAAVTVIAVIDGRELVLRRPQGRITPGGETRHEHREWRRRSPTVETPNADLAAVLARSVEDLGVLRIFDPEHPERAVVAAGVPWYMALFGRDSLLTSWMLLPVDSSVALGTLQTLADHQGRTANPASEEEPGRILHEMRLGPRTELALGGRGVYYGSVDATPLFVMLLGELSRWGRHAEQVHALIPHADRALEWMQSYGDSDGDGFIEYRRKTERGLANQGWKDSWDGVNFADGTIAAAPIALAEVQGYAYAAYLARAQLAAEYGEAETARQWLGKAGELKGAFNSAFWLPDRGWFAAGLDPNKQPIDALTSNIGHCLWTGIVDEDKAASVADHLLSDDMFTGWGIRTLAASMGAYNPLSYHNGSVWPHDTALCVAGLMRYGFVEHAQRAANGLLEAARHFGYRLPELLGGFDRREFDEPVPYPTSCSPQAWSAASPLAVLRALLRFDPDLTNDRVWCAPEVPDIYLPLRLSNLRLGEHPVTVHLNIDDWSLDGLADSGVRLIRVPRPVETTADPMRDAAVSTRAPAG